MKMPLFLPDTLQRPALEDAPPSIADHQLIRRIGRGSYGEVWLGRSMMGSWRAIKVIGQGPEGSSGFQRELAGIRKFEPVSRGSAGLVHILQVGQDPARRYFYYVMELADDGNREEPWSFSHAPALRGDLDPETYIPRTLSLERRRQGRLPARDCLEIALALTEGLANLPDQGLVHRDLKPANIIFVQGQVKLADIGLVAEMSEANSYVGTEGYIAPEGPNSPQGDIYSLGKVLYEISTGKDRQDFPEPVTLLEESERKILQELNAVILKACAPQLSSRYATAREMHAELLLIQSGQSVRSRRLTRQRVRWMGWAAAAAAVAAMLALVSEKFLESRVQTLQGRSTLLRPALIGKVAPREDTAPPETVDLSAYYTAPLTEAWYPGPKENTLASLPRGIQRFGQARFDVRGLVQLAGGEINNYDTREGYPRQVRGIPMDRWVKRLHFLHGAVSEVTDGKEIGCYQVEYGSGRVLKIPITYGQEVRALWQPAENPGLASAASVAWSGQNPATLERNLALRIYQHTWENPRPDDQIVHVDFVSRLANSAPFLIALTGEPHEPPPDKKQVPLDLVAALQKAASSFPKVEPAMAAANAEFKTWQLNTRSLEVAGEFYDGFRFTMPAGQPVDFVWAFMAPQNLASRGWHLMPVEGRMKIGFEDWYHGIAEKADPASARSEFKLQFLNGKKLKPGAEYFIWFAFDNAEPVELKAVMRFAPRADVNANQPDTLMRALGLEPGGGDQRMSFHRHYCLGAVR